ncbi:MFS transporter, partial [Burkholderia sp.]|uniref:MFS transporter n=1 Tax=Burkholderia sp. TaxID=36773 RepID=UPI0025C5749E
VLVILQQTLSAAELKAWGWRIPFVVGAAAALISLYLRKSLDETSTSESRDKKDAGTIRGVWQHKGAFFTVVGFTAGGSLIFYTFTTYMQKYLVNTAGMHAKTASNVMTVALFVYMLLQPVFGALSDRIGRRQSMILFGVCSVIGTVPLMHALKDVTSPVMAFVLITVALAIVSFYTSISGLIKAEMFPPEVRAMGVGLSYAVANAIFGGSAEYVALWFKSIGSEETFYWYVTVLCAVSLLVSYKMRDPSKEGYLRLEP